MSRCFPVLHSVSLRVVGKRLQAHVMMDNLRRSAPDPDSGGVGGWLTVKQLETTAFSTTLERES